MRLWRLFDSVVIRATACRFAGALFQHHARDELLTNIPALVLCNLEAVRAATVIRGVVR